MGPRELSGRNHVSTPPKRKREPEDLPADAEDDFHQRDERATALVKEGQLSMARTALLNEPPPAYSETTAKGIRDRHPAPGAEAELRSGTVGASPTTLQGLHLECRD